MLQRLGAAVIGFLNQFDLLGESVSQEETAVKSFDDHSGSVPNLVYPGDNCLTYYTDRDFTGDHETFCLSAESNGLTVEASNDSDLLWWTSSFESGKNIRYEFRNKWDSGVGYDILTGAGHVRSGRIEKYMEDKVKSLTITYYDERVQGIVNLWGWTGCQDSGAGLQGPRNIYDAASTYTDDEAWQYGMGYSEVESVNVPLGYQITLYDSENLTGENYVVKGGANLDDNQFIDCVDLPGEWQDRAKSFEVRKIQEVGKAKVKWVSIQATEPFAFHVQYGYQNTNEYATSETNSNTFSYEMSEGFEFEGLSESWTLSESYTHEVTESTSQSQTVQFGAQLDITCTPPRGETGAGLFQQVSYGTDGTFTVYGQKTVCRYGSLWQTEPACPFEACLDAECLDCAPGWYTDHHPL